MSFKQMEVKVRKLACRHHVKVATGGEVTMMSNPLQFRVLEGPLLLLQPTPA